MHIPSSCEPILRAPQGQEPPSEKTAVATNEHDDSQRWPASYKMLLTSYSRVAKPSELANLLQKQLCRAATPSARKPLSTEAWAKYEGWPLPNTALWYCTCMRE